MPQLLKNNVSGVLASGINAVQTSITLVDASNFPSPTGGDFFLATLIGLNSNGQESSWEVVRCTARSTNTLTVVRGQEGTSGASWSAATTLQMRATAGTVYPIASGGTGASDAATARTNLGLAIGTNVQAYDADLAAIAGLAGASGFLKKTAVDTWSLDTSTYLTGNQSITFSGDASGSGTTAVSLTLANSGATAGTYRSVTVDAKGRVTAGTNPTTLSGYGITDAQPLDADLTAIAGLAGTSGFLKKTAADTWSLDTGTYLTSNQSITLSGDVSGSGSTAISVTLATVTAAKGGTGQTSYAVGDLLYASTTTALSKLADVATGNALISGGVGVAPSYGKIGLTTHVSGTLPVGNGGTGLTTYAVGDLVYASASGTLASLADVATGNALISGGVGVAPSYGKIGLTTHVSGTLAVGNGGTGASTAGITAFNNITGYTAAGATGTTSTNLVFSTSPSLTTPALAGETFSTTNNVTAGTNAQGQGALTSDYNVITTATANPSGVTLPTATQGRRVVIVNKGANSVNVYPATGGAIDALAANAAIALPVNGVMEFNASSTTQWYSSFNSTVSSSGVASISFGTTGLTPNSATTGAVTVAGTLAVANGGSGQTTAQAAMNAFAGAVTSGQYLRGNGTNVVMSAIQAADVPTLNQNTTGTAANVTGTVAVANGGTGATTLTGVLKGNGTSAFTAATAGTDYTSPSSTETMTNKTISNGVYSGTVDQTGSVRGGITAVAALDIVCSSGNYFTKTIAANSTFTVSSVPASRAYAFTLELTHTSGTVTWFSGVQWPGGTAPTLTTGKVHLFTFVTDDGGTSWRGASQVNYNS